MFAIRAGRPTDHGTFLELFQELEVPDPLPTRETFEASILPGLFFLCEGERVVGYGHGQPIGPSWHVMHVVTARGARGRGVGAAIMAEHARRARGAARARWHLNVKRDNPTAIRLYQRSGMSIAFASWAMIIDWADVAHLPDSPPGTPSVLAPEQDEAFERALGLGAGEIAAQRARPGRVVVGVRAGDQATAWASFVPAFPGAMPFRPIDARYTRALFEAMRPHARPEHAHVRMFVERDEAVARACEAAGGRVLVELYRMEGDVPR